MVADIMELPPAVLAKRGTVGIRPSDELGGFFMTKEGNSILYPLFMLGNKLSKDGTDVKITKKVFDLEVRGRKCQVGMQCVDGVPSEFEYDVYNAICAIRAISDVDPDKPIEFTATDILKMLKLSDSGTNYKRVETAVDRLMTTIYQFDEFFERRLVASEIDGSDQHAGWNDDVPEHFADMYGGKVPEISVSVSSDSSGATITSRSKRENVTLFQKAEKIMDKDSSGQIVKSSYCIKFHDKFANSIKAKFSRRFDIAAYFQLKAPSLKRFYEIISFEANRSWDYTVQYETIASLIPINSGRMNKQYIIGYAKRLKEMGYIADFDTVSDKKSIKIIFRTKENVPALTAQGAQWTDEQKVQYLSMVRDILKKRNLEGEFDANEFLAIASDPERNPLRLSPESAAKNLVYMLYRRNRITDSPYGYYCAAMIGDYASKSKKSYNKEKVPKSDGEKIAEPEKKKGPRPSDYWSAFDKFFSSASPETITEAENALGIASFSRVQNFSKQGMVLKLAEGGFQITVPAPDNAK